MNRRWGLRAGFLAFLLSLAACGSGNNDATRTAYDVIIRGGTVYDGTGGTGVVADVAIAADTIAFVGELSDGASADTEIDASGLAVAPGFINVLSWANESLLHDGRSQSDIRQGVTLRCSARAGRWARGRTR
jgi:N-acyl-D-amino-acid deacylase